MRRHQHHRPRLLGLRSGDGAYAFWQRAAEMGSMESQAFIGNKLRGNHDEPPSFWGNWPVARTMMECAFAQGSAEGAYLLGLVLNVKSKSPEDYRRALMVMHEGVKRGCKACASYLSASFDGGSRIVGRAKDPFRHERYFAISERLRLDHHLKLPNLDRVLPLPPAALPHWNSDPDTLIDAANGARIPSRP